jgi:hypothetical protein
MPGVSKDKVNMQNGLFHSLHKLELGSFGLLFIFSLFSRCNSNLRCNKLFILDLQNAVNEDFQYVYVRSGKMST